MRSVLVNIVMEMSEVFKAWGDPTRLRIIRMLVSKIESSLGVSDMANKLGITQPAAPQHIKVLKSQCGEAKAIAYIRC